MTRALIVLLALALAPAALGQGRPAPKKKAGPAAPAAQPQPQTRQLRVLQQVMPAYQQIPGAQDGGCVTVKFVIKYDGFVGDVEVIEARPEALAAPTAAALKQWQFQSFPPPDLQTVQTFNFAPEQVRMPDDYVRSPLAVAGADGTLANQGCGAGKAAKPAVTQGKSG